MFIFFVFVIVMNHIPYELYQVYVEKMISSFDNNALADSSALVLGFHTAFSMFVAAFFAKRAMKVQKALGTKPALILLMVLLTALIAIMGIKTSYIVVVLLMLRGVAGSIINPILRAETTHKLEPSLRATYYSTKSLIGRISFAGVLFLFGVVPGDGFNNSVMLGSSIGIVFILVLVLLPINKKS